MKPLEDMKPVDMDDTGIELDPEEPQKILGGFEIFNSS